MDSKHYTDMLTEHYLEDFFLVARNRATFQQENAPIHVSRHSKSFFSDKNVLLMDCLGLAPSITSGVYGQGKQYDS